VYSGGVLQSDSIALKNAKSVRKAQCQLNNKKMTDVSELAILEY